MDLFEKQAEGHGPLADRMRPRTLEEVVGQRELLAEGALLARLIRADRIPSMILWGPPGTGKTTLARVIAHETASTFVPFSAVLGGVPELRKLLTAASERRATWGKGTLLFVDEIHRFNKAQQDVLLPYIEEGTLVLVGATTENPSFSLNNALLSRCRVIVLGAIDADGLKRIVGRALETLGAENSGFGLSDEAVGWLAQAACGDARYVLNSLEALIDAGSSRHWTLAEVQAHWSRKSAQYDRDGDFHYDLISALHKCVRDSDADAAVYWLARMLTAGEEPLYIARRLIRMATEDVGLADPHALSITLEARRMYEVLGSPEGEQGLFAAVIYLALAPKSNAAYVAEKAARGLAKAYPDAPVPIHLRNAPTGLMKELGHGEGYQYAHDAADGVVAQQHFPEGVACKGLYSPTERGFEKKLGERIRWLEERRGMKGRNNK